MRFTITAFALITAFPIPACDSPEDEAGLQALDIEEEAEAQEDAQGSPAPSHQRDLTDTSPQPVAALPNQLCRVDSVGPNIILYTSPGSGIWVPPNSLVRILDYAGQYHYLARYAGTTGQLERSRVVQSSCYYQ